MPWGMRLYDGIVSHVRGFARACVTLFVLCDCWHHVGRVFSPLVSTFGHMFFIYIYLHVCIVGQLQGLPWSVQRISLCGFDMMTQFRFDLQRFVWCVNMSEI